MNEQEQTQEEVLDLSEKESKEDVASLSDDIGLPTMDNILPEITLEDVFDTSLLPTF